MVRCSQPLSLPTAFEDYHAMCLKKFLDWLLRREKRPNKGNIKHVILLMFENHSFDQMLGCFKALYSHLTGVDPAHPRSNKDSLGREYFQHETTNTVIDPDPMHELTHILN